MSLTSCLLQRLWGKGVNSFTSVTAQTPDAEEAAVGFLFVVVSHGAVSQRVTRPAR